MVLEEYHRVLAHIKWVYEDNYMTWFYMVSHLIMTLDPSGRPPRSSNQEVLEAQDDHIEDVIVVCQRVWEMGRAGIKARLFKDDRL